MLVLSLEMTTRRGEKIEGVRLGWGEKVAGLGKVGSGWKREEESWAREGESPRTEVRVWFVLENHFLFNFKTGSQIPFF
jgi:hypothetical protein